MTPVSKPPVEAIWAEVELSFYVTAPSATGRPVMVKVFADLI